MAISKPSFAARCVFLALGLVASGPAAASAVDSDETLDGSVFFSLVTPRFEPWAPWYCSLSPLDSKLEALDASGASARVTSGTDLLEFDASVSSDGRTIAFIGSNQSRPPAIFVADRSTGEVTEKREFDSDAAYEDVGRVTVSPDGSQLMWLPWDRGSTPEVTSLVIASAFGPERQVVELGPGPAGAGSEPAVISDAAFMPDGRILVLWRNPAWSEAPSRLEVMQLDGSERTPIGPDLSGVHAVQMHLAPDGQRVLLAGMDEEGEIAWSRAELDEPGALPRPIDISSTEVGWAPDSRAVLWIPVDRLRTLLRRDLDTGEDSLVFAAEDAMICQPVSVPVLPPGGDEADTRTAPIFERGDIAAGSYDIDVFVPPMRVTLPDGWNVDHNHPDAWRVQRVPDTAEAREGRLPHISADRLSVGLAGPCREDPSVLIGPTVEGVFDWLATRSDLVVGPPSAVVIGDHSGVSVDIRPDTRTLPCGARELQEGLWHLFFSAEQVQTLTTGETLRLTVVDVDGVAVSLSMQAGDEQFDSFAADVQPIFDSVEFIQVAADG